MGNIDLLYIVLNVSSSNLYRWSEKMRWEFTTITVTPCRAFCPYKKLIGTRKYLICFFLCASKTFSEFIVTLLRFWAVQIPRGLELVRGNFRERWFIWWYFSVPLRFESSFWNSFLLRCWALSLQKFVSIRSRSSFPFFMQTLTISKQLMRQMTKGMWESFAIKPKISRATFSRSLF